MENKEIIDETEFQLPSWMLAKLFEGYAYKELQNTFEYGKIALLVSDLKLPLHWRETDFILMQQCAS